MNSYLTVIPAYGRDYHNQNEVIDAWNSDNDFKIVEFHSPYYGSYINKSDCINYGITGLRVRYNRNRKIMVVE